MTDLILIMGDEMNRADTDAPGQFLPKAQGAPYGVGSVTYGVLTVTSRSSVTER